MAKKEKSLDKMIDEELLDVLSSSSRIKRKNASKQLKVLVKENPQEYLCYINNFIDALDNPEAQTRWECLEILAKLVDLDDKKCKPAIDGAEEALFDEKTSLIRVSAIRFLCKYGAISPKNSKEVWPIIKEGIQQFHGEIEFDEMLKYVYYFAKGKIDKTVFEQLLQEMITNLDGVIGTTEYRIVKIIDTMDPNFKREEQTNG